ncbi:tetratricopeptide repeat protein [Ruegeria arenilitoris]|uniref:tetratricopeptide repeat protein n=1 Tax=Ruegeria arenilitoris TaxID=1173585 RepID=UPI001480BA02|nr:hypothetical protein [Ruegeria arenilitoris]
MRDPASGTSENVGGDPRLREVEMRDAISRVLKSDLFSSTPRLREFLDFVAGETILGNTDKLRAKSIAHFVYDRDPVDERSSANLVRVEARRLRRLLEDYYETEGQSDPVRVHIDKGGYAPRFERQRVQFEKSAPEPTEASAYDGLAAAEIARRPAKHLLRVTAILGVIGLIALTVLYLLLSDPTRTPAVKSERLEREALMERSPAALEAANLTAQARGLIYPIFDAERQRLTTELFRAAIDIDPNAAGAYAGAAQTLASQALLSIDGPQHDAFLGEANEMLARALKLNPSHAWSQSAAGWVAFVEGNFENAMRYSERAASLAPNDGNVLDFFGVVAVLSGAWETAVHAALQERQRAGANTRYADQNILAAARFHMGEFEEAARIIEDSNARGGPLSAPGVVYLAATYQALGRERDGQRMLALLEEDWPGFPAEVVLKRLHRREENALEVINRLRALGWKD